MSRPLEAAPPLVEREAPGRGQQPGERALRGGLPLDAGVASRMGSALGHSFADVRIHDGPEAAAFVSHHGTVAATVGTDVAFAPGAFRPGTEMGDALLAHELAHVQQQRGAASGAAPKADADASLELDAHQAAVGAFGHLYGIAVPGARRGASRRGGLRVQRCGSEPQSWAPAMPAGALTPGRTASSGRPFIDGALADTMLARNRIVGPYVRTQIRTGTSRCGGAPVPVRSEDHLHFYDNADWQDVSLNYLSRGANPAQGGRCDSRFTEAEARAFPAMAAFQDATEIRINQDTAQDSDPIHESMHLHQHPDFEPELGYAAQEGATEYLAERVLTDEGRAFSPTYVNQTNSIRTLVESSTGTGAVPLCEAYFNGDFGPLRTAMNREHPGRYTVWKDRMNRTTPDYSGADALFA